MVLKQMNYPKEIIDETNNYTDRKEKWDKNIIICIVYNYVSSSLLNIPLLF
jgi:hypothetical protein